ncbi:class I SAM-dependent methyltransferase [Spongiactinospora sp. TRM90649]|uniref:O-methyltransferase n=1 Tax=Spongiactinospora sp. TRM90649 TaxID=3031114 RepID=UPI0023F880D8|nr:class I SAM-dependent methyltransferase [Spongiactinospora sp. TRM90649]MDF5757478.1 class I SAM-dependent methyltransferase [Spongiactinospora sp. TRM90649]
MERIRLPAPTTRQLLLTSTLVGGLLIIGLALLSVSGAVQWPDAIQLALTAVCLAGVAVAVLTVRRADGKALRIDQRVKKHDAAFGELRDGVRALKAQVDEVKSAQRAGVGTVVTALGEDRAELAGHTALLREQAARLDAQRTVLDAHASALSGLGKTGDKLAEQLAEQTRRARARTEYHQVEAMIDLRLLLAPRAPLPRLRGWAASPDVLRLLVERIAAERPKLVIECGSGSSSVWLGYAMERFGGGRIVALEHEERFARASRDLVTAHGLESVVEVRHAPLTDWQGHQWYDPAAFDDLGDAGLVFVDGPPGNLGPGARYPAVPLLLPHCAPGAWLVLDDTVREDERDVAERWLREYPELTATPFAAEKGAMVFERGAL